MSRISAWKEAQRNRWLNHEPTAKNRCLTCRVEIRVGGVSCSHCRQTRRRLARSGSKQEQLGRYVGEMLYNLIWRSV